MNDAHQTVDLETALSELAIQEPFTAETIEVVVQRYPQFSKELRAAAPSIALELLAQSDMPASAAGQPKPVVKSAMESFSRSLEQVKAELDTDSPLRATR